MTWLKIGVGLAVAAGLGWLLANPEPEYTPWEDTPAPEVSNYPQGWEKGEANVFPGESVEKCLDWEETSNTIDPGENYDLIAIYRSANQLTSFKLDCVILDTSKYSQQ